MHPADLVILAALALSLIFGFTRGFVREAFALAGWVLAILIARSFNEPLAAWLAQWVSTPSIRLVLSYGTLFFGTVLTFSLLGTAFRHVVHGGGLSLPDRMLGGLFGVARGALLVLIALMLMAPFVKRDAWFRDAMLPKTILQYETLARSLQKQALALVRPIPSSSSTSKSSH
ncbi:MAG: CvpA family protein [Pseudomonadota bacterium]